MDDNLGREAQDKVTGFNGIIIVKAEHIFGCEQYGVVPTRQTDEKVYNKPVWFDRYRLTIGKKVINPEDVRNPLFNEK